MIGVLALVRPWRHRVPVAAAAISAVLAAGCVGPTATSSPATTVPAGSPITTVRPSPTAATPRADGWRTATPETEGMDSPTLADGLRQLAAHHSPIHSLLIARHGRIVLDAYAYPYDGSTYHDLASVTKSITTTLIGIAADQGLLGLDAPMLSFFPERTIANRTERKERITVRHLASMTSGLDCRVDAREMTLRQMRASDDWVQFVLDLDTVAEPGRTFSYCSPGMHLLSAILARATGTSALDFARVNLFEPLGIDDVYWTADADGNSYGWGDLALHPADAAKIGLLFLQHGRWKNDPVISAEWVAAATTAQVTSTGRSEGYGYGWWVSLPAAEPTMFRADGNGGQRILGVPPWDLIVVTTGGGFSLDEATPFILASVTGSWQPLPANSGGLEQLDAAAAALSVAPDAEPTTELPPTAAAISGRSIEFEANAYHLRSLKLQFMAGASEATAVMDVGGEGVVREMVIGLDGRWRPSVGGRPIVARGSWTDATTFQFQVDEGPGIARYTVRTVVDGAIVRLELVGVADELVSIPGSLGGQ